MPLDYAVPIDTHINMAWFAEQFTGYPDQELVEHVIDGVNFKADLELQIVLNPHLTTLPSFVRGTESELVWLVECGWPRCFDSLSFVPIRVHGSGSVPRKRDKRHRCTSEYGAPRH